MVHILSKCMKKYLFPLTDVIFFINFHSYVSGTEWGPEDLNWPNHTSVHVFRRSPLHSQSPLNRIVRVLKLNIQIKAVSSPISKWSPFSSLSSFSSGPWVQGNIFLVVENAS